MTSSKDTQHSSRPLGQHRLSITSGSLPSRSTHNRHHSHSISSGSANATHRVTRRKSVSTNVASIAAMAAAAREAGENPHAIPTIRRNTNSRAGGIKTGMPTPPSSLPMHKLSLGAKHRIGRDEDAIDDEDNDDFDEDDNFNKARMRRASEGQPIKGDGKRSTSNELKCTKCGKGYKHSSCLTKHLWEHTPEWSYTSKLLISKHQQVQLLEAASVLVAMNSIDAPSPPDSARDFQSDQDSVSPSASGSSDQNDGLSSTDTTPPPQADLQAAYSYTGSSYSARPKRYSSGNSFSRSYQSAPSNSRLSGSVSNGSGFGQYHRQSSERRPLSSGLSSGGQEDEAGLAAAVELLSCSFGTPRTGPVTLPPDAPPVPPLPAQYMSQSILSGSSLTPIHHLQPASTSYVRDEIYSHDRDMKMEEESVMDDDEYDARSRDRSDEDDDGVFGRMEE